MTIDAQGSIHDQAGKFAGHIQTEGDTEHVLDTSIVKAPLTGQEARDALAVIGVEAPDDLKCEVFDAPQAAGWVDPELYESTVAIFTGPAGVVEVYREGDSCVYLPNERRHLNSVEEFREEFPEGNIPHEEADNPNYYWRDNAWFVTTLNGKPVSDEIEWHLPTALGDAARLAAGRA